MVAMNRFCCGIWLLAALAIHAQTAAAPIFLGRTTVLLPPASGGSTVVVGSSLAPDGTVLPAVDVYAAGIDGSAARRLTKFEGDVIPAIGASSVAITADGSRAAFSAVTGGRREEVHVVETGTGNDRVVSVYTEGCIQPLLLCIGCSFSCVYSPHIAPDGSQVLCAVRAGKPFFTARADGTGAVRLPVYSGTLAPSSQRVISRNGLAVFTSAAPFGPTLAAAATDVYVMSLDGSDIRAVTRLGSDASLFAGNAVISSDGATIAFESNRDPETGAAAKTTHVYVVRADGAGLRAIAQGTSPSISSDGTQLAFAREGRIYTARSDGTGITSLTAFKTSFAQDPAITDDGSAVVFSLGPQSGSRGAVYAVNTDGSGLHAVYAPRSLNLNGVVGGVTGAAPSPGSLFAAYGTNLASDGMTAVTGFPLPDALAGLSLLVNGTPAPLLAVTPWQVNAQLSQLTPEGPAAFQLRFTDGAQPAAVAADVINFSPRIYSTPDCQAFYHASSGLPADDAHPADPGEVLVSFWTGLGQTSPIVPAGTPAPANPPAESAKPDVTIGGQPAKVTFAGLAPGFAGLYQVNVAVPAGLKPGRQAVNWRNQDGVLIGSCAGVSIR